MKRSEADQLRNEMRLQKCDECDAPFFRSSRSDRLTCSTACRKRRSRRLQDEK